MEQLIVTPQQAKEEKEKHPFLLPELEQTEVEAILKASPGTARAFIEKCAKGELNWDAFTPVERGILLHGTVESQLKDPSEISVLHALREADWLREPPTPEQFVNDPKYLGIEMSKSIYAPWRKDLIYVLDPKNEIHEWILSGGIGVGKCTNSFVFNSLGLLHVSELFDNKSQNALLLSEAGLKNIEEYHYEGETETNIIFNNLGYKLECRPNHKIRVFTGKEIIWKESKDIANADQTILVRHPDVWGKNPFNLSIEEAEFFGIVIGDGYILENKKIEITFGDREEDKKYLNEIISNITDKLSSHFTLRKEKNRRCNRLSYYRVDQIKHWHMGGLIGRSWEKKVPIAIRMGTKEVVAAFIRGLFDTDGTVYEKGNAVEFSTCSTDLSEQVQLLLLNFGIVSSRSFKKNKFRGSWTVRLIGRESKQIFAKEIGFRHPKKAERLKALLEREAKTWRHNDHDVIPIDWQIVAQIRDSVRGKGLDLKHNRDMFVCVKTKGKQAFTYRALDKIVEHYGEQYLPDILKKIYKERYIFSGVKINTPSRNFCWDFTVKGDPSYISNGFISHNTRIAIIAQLYKLCILTCLRNIPAYFALDSATSISFGLFSLSLEKAETAISEDFKKIISQSPYFKNVFPLKKSRAIKSVLNNQNSSSKTQSEYEVVLPQGLRILMGSKVSHALSFAVVSAILDEMNFRNKRTVKHDDDEDSSEKLYSQVRYRITSRFERLGYVPGLLCVISSKKTSSDFLESHISKLDGRLTQQTGSWVSRNDPHAFISSYSQWDVKPEKYFDQGKKTFFVFIGSSQASSRIIRNDELADFPTDSPNILEVPESVRKHFEYDINSALRELAGISSTPQHLLLEDPTHMKKIIDHNRVSPFIDDTLYIGIKTNRSISTYLKSEAFFFDAGFAMLPKWHPDMIRTVHVDLSKSGDATGIAMGGISCIKQMVAQNLLGQNLISSYVPEYFIDFAIELKAPQGDQIDYEKIQQFINYLRSVGFRINYVSFDQFQSVSPMQMLLKDGFVVGNTSVDRSDLPYVMLRDSIVKGNLRIYKNPVFEKQLLNLIHDYSGARAKVDHPRMNPDGSKGAKDVSDAVAAVVFNCVEMMTDAKKHPDTYNADIASKIIGDMYNKVNTSNNLGEYFTHSPEEQANLKDYIDLVNPLKFEIK